MTRWEISRLGWMDRFTKSVRSRTSHESPSLEFDFRTKLTTTGGEKSREDTPAIGFRTTQRFRRSPNYRVPYVHISILDTAKDVRAMEIMRQSYAVGTSSSLADNPYYTDKVDHPSRTRNQALHQRCGINNLVLVGRSSCTAGFGRCE